MTIREKLRIADDTVRDCNVPESEKRTAMNTINKIKKFIETKYYFDDEYETAEKIEN